jgi:uncharacterized protein involved in cysteine biosynthesis
VRGAPRQNCRLCAGGTRSPGRSGWGVFDLLRGFGLFVQALFELLGAREYRSRLGLAVLANLVLWCTAAALAFYGVHGWIEAQSTALPEWLTSWISWAGAALSVLLTAGLALYVFPPLFVLLLFPILDPISRIAEGRILGWMPPDSVRGVWGDLVDGLATALRTLFWQLLALILTLPLALTGIGLPIAMLISGYFAGLAWLDYPLARRGHGFSTKWRRARQNGWLVSGFGVAFQLALLIPFVGFLFATPAAAVGSARLFYNLREDDLRAAPRR